MIPAQQLIDESRKLIGTPWKHTGRTTRGVDCVGMVLLAAKNAGVDLAQYGVRDQAVYGRGAQPLLLEKVEQYCKRIAEPVPGCLLFFRFYNDRHPKHFGIYTERDTMIHADTKRGLVVEHGHRAHWKSQTHSCWLLPGVTYV